MLLDVAGGERGGDGTPQSIAQGPLSVFGNSSTNPWSTEVFTSMTDVIIKPSQNMGVNGKYSIFVEYISHEIGGKMESIRQNISDAILFNY